jgi:hypothetical protein
VGSGQARTRARLKAWGPLEFPGAATVDDGQVIRGFSGAQVRRCKQQEARVGSL